MQNPAAFNPHYISAAGQYTGMPQHGGAGAVPAAGLDAAANSSLTPAGMVPPSAGMSPAVSAKAPRPDRLEVGRYGSVWSKLVALRS